MRRQPEGELPSGWWRAGGALTSWSGGSGHGPRALAGSGFPLYLCRVWGGRFPKEVAASAWTMRPPPRSDGGWGRGWARRAVAGGGVEPVYRCRRVWGGVWGGVYPRAAALALSAWLGRDLPYRSLG